MDTEDMLLVLNCFQVVVAMFAVVCQLAEQQNEPNDNGRRWWVRPDNEGRETQGAYRTVFKRIKREDHEAFVKYTRMTVEQFDSLLELTKPRLLKRSRRKPLCPEEKLAMTLKYLAHGGSRHAVADEYLVGRSTFAKVLVEVCSVIWNALSPRYVCEPSASDWQEIRAQFWEKFNFPNCLGAIGGKHVRCKPFLDTDANKTLSVVLLACCDAEYTFTWVDVGNYGSENNDVFSKSVFGKMVLHGNARFLPDQALPGADVVTPCVFVADGAFPLTECIMRPFPGRELTLEQSAFNRRLARARRTVENSFAILASRWKVYDQNLQGSPDTVRRIVLATTALHNFVMKTGRLEYVPRVFVEDEASVDELKEEEEWRKSVYSQLINLGASRRNASSRAAIAVRRELGNFFTSQAGEVPWQWSQTYAQL